MKEQKILSRSKSLSERNLTIRTGFIGLIARFDLQSAKGFIRQVGHSGEMFGSLYAFNGQKVCPIVQADPHPLMDVDDQLSVTRIDLASRIVFVLAHTVRFVPDGRKGKFIPIHSCVEYWGFENEYTRAAIKAGNFLPPVPQLLIRGHRASYIDKTSLPKDLQ
ncbi:MAG: hypothetical protein PHF79_01880 [Candidatus Pacebacteria bacterium]|nr:hypothetical protein [Candidatus Paceibacterota bacterium]